MLVLPAAMQWKMQAVPLPSVIGFFISDATCTALSSAGVLLDLDSKAACGIEMPLAKALDASACQ